MAQTSMHAKEQANGDLYACKFQERLKSVSPLAAVDFKRSYRDNMPGWEGFVFDMMKNTGLFDNAAIFSKTDLSIWAQTTDFNVRTLRKQTLSLFLNTEPTLFP